VSKEKYTYMAQSIHRWTELPHTGEIFNFYD